MDLTPEMREALDTVREENQTDWGRRMEEARQQIARLEAGLRRETELHCNAILRIEELSEQVKSQQARAEFAEAEVARLEAWFEYRQELALDRQVTIRRITALEEELQRVRQEGASLRQQLATEVEQSSRAMLEVVDLKLELEKARQTPSAPAKPGANLPQLVPEPGEREDEQRHVQRLAYEDPVTSLPNFHLGLRYLEQQLQLSARGEGTLALLRVDLQRLRELNLVLGSGVTDEVLRLFARRCQACISGEQVLVRGRDDEFWFILAGPQRGPLGLKSVAEQASQVAQRLLGSLKEPFSVEDHSVTVQIACGIMVSQGKEEPNQVVDCAGLALSASKVEPTRKPQVYQPEMQKPLRRRQERAPLLRQALQREQFELFYQPIVELKSRQIKAVECLLRWNHPVEGRMEPSEFIDAALESGVMVGIGEWVATQVCQLSQNQRQYLFAFNVSAQELLQSDFVKRIRQALQGAHMARPENLIVEVSETGLAGADSDRLLAALKELKRWRVQLAIDDFSFDTLSLRRLQALEISFLKLSPEVTANLELPLYRNLVRGAVLAAESMGCKLVAEGIEMPAQMETLTQLGCHWGQGHFLRPPADSSELARLLEPR